MTKTGDNLSEQNNHGCYLQKAFRLRSKADTFSVTAKKQMPVGVHCVVRVLQDSTQAVQRRRWYPAPVLLPGESHEWRSLVGCSPWGRKELDTIEWLHFDFSLSCIGEGNGNPLQCFCLENPRDGGAWWAGVYGVAQSRTRLKWLSNSSSSSTQAVNLVWEVETLEEG